MKIAIITPYENFPGGVESVNEILKSIFEEAGHHVELITTDEYKKDIKTRIMVKFVGLPYITATKFKHVAHQYDLVLANGEFGWGITHSKCINLFHGTYLGYRDYLSKLWSWRQKVNFTRLAWIQTKASKGKYIVSVSKFVANILSQQNIKVNEVISNCIDTELFKPDDSVHKKECYLFVGSYNFYAKGFDVLEALVDRGIKIDCVTNKNPGKKFGWIQNRSNEDMPSIYNQYKGLIFPSRFEGIGLVPLEAMACGLPVIVSDVGLGMELKEIYPELVIDGHIEKIDEYIEAIKGIENNYEYYCEASQKYIQERHNFNDYKNKWLDVIERVYNA